MPDQSNRLSLSPTTIQEYRESPRTDVFHTSVSPYFPIWMKISTQVVKSHEGVGQWCIRLSAGIILRKDHTRTQVQVPIHYLQWVCFMSDDQVCLQVSFCLSPSLTSLPFQLLSVLANWSKIEKMGKRWQPGVVDSVLALNPSNKPDGRRKKIKKN